MKTPKTPAPPSLAPASSSPIRIPIVHRFWGIVNLRNEVMPNAISYHRGLAIKRFIGKPGDRYGWGGTWAAAKRKGFRLVRLTITPHSANTDSTTPSSCITPA